MIGETPIQFIPATDELEKEAVEDAILVSYGKIKIKIFRPEYLIAIFLKVYRPNDRDKLIKLLEQAKINSRFLSKILERHNLTLKFKEFVKKYCE